MNKNNYIWDIAILLLGFALLLLIAVGDMRAEAEAVEIAESPTEDKLVTAAVLDAAYTAEAQIVVGYDWDYVTRVVMQEAGGNTQDLQLAVCQAIQNRCEDTLMNPEEVCRMAYTFPHKGDVSDSVKDACERIFLLGEVYAPVGDADMMYNPLIDGPSAIHEAQKYICTIEQVRFFKEG